MHVTLVSTYELGRQPFGLASPAAWLKAAGHDVRTLDLSRERLDESALSRSGLVAFHLPMHTATRLAGPVISRVRALAPAATIAAYGVYAPPNEAWLRALGADEVLGPECEPDLVRLASSPAPDDARAIDRSASALPRLQFQVPDRSGLPALSRYAALRRPGGERLVAGYTEATRGCRHLCRHCPVVPVYQGRFRVVQPEIVLADIRAQVDAGARHITFGDPDFLNGPAHAIRIVDALAHEWPGLTYDVVIKVEHLLRHPRALERLRDTGCLFVTSAFESFDDVVLARLDKGHTRTDIERAVTLTRAIGLPVAPTFVAFTPWTTLESYLGMLDAIEALDLVSNVAPIQLGIRLLVPAGSLLLGLPDVQVVLDGFDEAALAYTWRHADPRVDALSHDVFALVARSQSSSRSGVFEAVQAVASRAAGVSAVCGSASTRPLPARASIPYLDEPWYC